MDKISSLQGEFPHPPCTDKTVTFGMNYLAHIFLSGSDPLVRIGNFMADGVRGKSYLNMPEALQKGILLHREIDTFTDAHRLVRQGTKRLHSRYHHYSGVIVDLFYDHFLSRNWKHYSEEPLEAFISDFYKQIQSHESHLIPRVRDFVPIMIQYDWLGSYGNLSGLQRILSQMDRRTQNRVGMANSIEELQAFYALYEAEFNEFFAELQTHCAEFLVNWKPQTS